MTSHAAMRDKAVALAKQGLFRVLPIKPGTKAPACPPSRPRPLKGTYHQHIPSKDPDVVYKLWSAADGSALAFDIGINCEGKLVLDIDDRDGRTGTESFTKLAAQHGLDLNTVVASTPSGGRHYFYKLPTDIDPTTVGFGSDKLGSGIDHRSYNSLVVAAGTKRASGEYRWVQSPTECDMKEAPRSLVELCQRPRERKPHDPLVVPGFEPDPPDAIAWFREYASTHAPEAVSGAGGRNDTIALLRRAGDHGLMAATAVETLCEPGGWNESKAHPPWDEDELLELAESLEPSRARPIGCDHAFSQFDCVEIDDNIDSTDGHKMQPLTLAWWGGRNLPEPTTMCGRWLTTTSRVILNAPTGLGKSMFTVALGMAIAACKDFLSWKAADRPFRVLYIDGEMSNRLLKQRLADEARRLGYAPETFYALSHEDLALGPLNTPAGQKQIESVITMLGGLDLIMFDNVMSLIPGDQKEEEGWAKVTPWVRSLTRRSIGQFWVHHTGHDKTHGYGTKTREWQMDTTIHLTEVKRGNTDISFKLEFHKARERRPETRMDFKETRVALIDDRWTGTGVTGFEEPFHVPPTLQELGWTEQLAAWAGDECERLKLPPDAQTPITAPAAQEAWAVEGKKHSRQAAQKRLQQLTETGLLRKMGYGQWALVPKPT